MMNFNEELIIDNFAGGGGASTGMELSLGRSVDIAINHDPDAIAMHKANHPNTVHYCEDVFDINPLEVTKGRPVALCWLSPDCKHFSKAKGGKPVDKKIRGLAWIAVRWAARVKPRVIILENVEEFKSWGPLKDDRPDPEKKGQTFHIFVKQLQKEGYEVEWQELKACDYGAPTTRKRFFMIARCDGQPIVWPKKTHGARDNAQVIAKNLKPYRNASEIIDWSIPGNSIFERKKPLCDSTMKRIARGIAKFVIDNPDPFILKMEDQCLSTPTILVNTTNHSGSSLNDPLKTITTGGHHALVAPTLIQMGYGDSEGKRVLDTHKPLGTITSGGNKFATATAFISKYYGGFYSGAGIDMRDPTDTITQSDHHSLVVAFLTKYYGSEVGQDLNTPLHTITTKDRFGLVTIKGEDYKIVDISLRMLQPRELFLAQGFPSNYIIDKDQNGKKISKAKQIARCGNSVSPPIPKALVWSNLPEICKVGSFAEQVELLKESVG